MSEVRHPASGARAVPGRTSQWIDLVGNGIGIAAGLAVGGALVWATSQLRRRPTTS